MPPLCLHMEPFAIGEAQLTAAEIIARLAPCMTDERRARIAEIIANRTCSIVPVLDGLYDRGNVSAVLRSAESLGYQQVHVIDSSPRFMPANRVTQGAEKWLDVIEWPDAESCIARLRESGYRILAAHLDDARPIEDFSFDTPAAIVFGNEKDGVSSAVLNAADARLKIPMLGFSQSYNISVAAALCLYHVARNRIETLGAHGDLSGVEARCLTAEFYLRSVQNAEKILLNR